MGTFSKKSLFAAFVFVNLVASLVSCNKKNTTSSPEILVGEVGSLTGSEATFGTSTHEGIVMAMDEINAAGGISVAGQPAKKLKLITVDDQSKLDEAATAVTKLITQDRVTAILGEVASSRSLAMAPIAQSNKVPMVSPSSTNPKVTKVGDYIFRVCFIDPFQGAVMAKFAINTLKAKKAAVLRDVKSDYSVGFADFFTENFRKMGGEIVLDVSYSGGDSDFKSQLTSIKSKKPDVILVPGYYREVGLIARQAKEVGLSAPLLGGDGWDSEKLTEIAGDSLSGSFFSNHYSPDTKDERVQKFITEYKRRYKKTPDSLAAMGYDAMLVLADALKRSTSLSNVDLKKALSETKQFPAVTGVISLNSERDAVKSAVVIEVKGKSFVYKETVQPNS
jgi:branched-chain amino acid transport system substrate-binding protein